MGPCLPVYIIKPKVLKLLHWCYIVSSTAASIVPLGLLLSSTSMVFLYSSTLLQFCCPAVTVMPNCCFGWYSRILMQHIFLASLDHKSTQNLKAAHLPLTQTCDRPWSWDLYTVVSPSQYSYWCTWILGQQISDSSKKLCGQQWKNCCKLFNEMLVFTKRGSNF